MNARPTHESAAGRLYLALRKKARAEGRRTDELLQLAALEAFVDRLAGSVHASHFVLKGGVLLSAYDARRPTRDVDLAAHDLSSEPTAMAAVIADVLTVSREDGWTFGLTSAERIRDDAEYPGVRVHVPCALASAALEFHVDVSVGDVVDPPAIDVLLPRLLGGVVCTRGYPLSMVFAEKIVTALQRGVSNSRWRDFADLYSLSRLHSVLASELQRSLAGVAAARGVTLVPLATVLVGFNERAQDKWKAWVRKQQMSERVPLDFSELLAAVIAFVDPVLQGHAMKQTWDSWSARWVDSAEAP